ncbi:base excision DNA repair protein [Colletotrichum kahawae]|uniref:Base excision DNA repair protein n=1 Tax=Colletotrichum kahawae TaxID=34407 RepID=A0AAD9YL18_COLKA|nr:base excision DNA repair protein [Colletotrichum kahawae]
MRTRSAAKSHVDDDNAKAKRKLQDLKDPDVRKDRDNSMSGGNPKRRKEANKSSPSSSPAEEETPKAERKALSPAQKLSTKKWEAWSQHAHASPYPEFRRPTPEECQTTFEILENLHGDVVGENFADPDAPAQEYPYVMDALVVAALGQATSWANAKRAMKNMKVVYGSTFNYDAIVKGGMEKLIDALRPGGMQNRKAKILMQLLNDVKARHGKWDLQHLFNASDDDVVKEVVSYWGIGPKCAFCLLSICLKRDAFAVDTHIYRITGLWGWRPADASRELAQAHLDARIPNELKFALHYQFIVHGRECPACRGNGDKTAACEYKTALAHRNAERTG